MPIVLHRIDPTQTNAIRPKANGQWSRAYGATSGYFGLKCPAVGPSVDWTMPSSDSTGTQFLQSNGSGTLSWASVSVSGYLKQTPAANADNTVQPSGLSIVPLTIKQVASPNSDSLQVQNSSGAVLSGVDKSGNLYVDTTSYTQSIPGIEIRTANTSSMCQIALLRSDAVTGLLIYHNGNTFQSVLQSVYSGGDLLLINGSGAGLYVSHTGDVIFNGSLPKFTTNTTGAGSAALGANCPAAAPTAPYTWIEAHSSDGSTVYIPAWK